MNDFYVYKHTGPTGKVYIGITSQQPERRWRVDGSGYRENKRFYNAILKYGWDNFHHEILYSGLTHDEACEKEIALIAELRSYEFKYGYNQSLGGEHGNHGESTRQKLSEKVSGLWQNPAYRQHMSYVHKGQCRTGWHHTEESKAKMRDIVIERCKNPEYRAMLSQNAKAHADSAAMSQRARKAWANPVSREKMIAKSYGNKYRAKPVLCVETGVVYESTTAAAKALGVARETIGQVCRGKREKTHGYHWRFVNE